MNCFMIRESIEGGGNITGSIPITVRRTAAIGDSLCASIVADKLIEQGHLVNWQTHVMIHCVMRRHPRISVVSAPDSACHVDLDGAYERNPMRRQKHFHEMFMTVANDQLRRLGINLGAALNCRPKILVPPKRRNAIREAFSKYPKPWVFICPRSDTYSVRQVPDGIWSEAAARIDGTKFWLGRHPACTNTVDLKTQHVDNLIDWLSAADLLVSVDTGPMHIGAALGVPILALGQSSSPELHLGDQDDFRTIFPPLQCLNCQQNVCHINQWVPPCQNFDPSMIAAEANRKLRQIFSEDVSAIVAIYKPEVSTLNRCLDALIPQVQEIIVTGDGSSIKPDGSREHPKIRYVRKATPRIGYGRNANYGARHSNGKYLLLINDDVFLNPGAVEAMGREIVADPAVGLVANLLYYPDGTIYHAGKVRAANVRGWGHIDHRRKDHTFKGPIELENACLASCLVRREAFYKVGGFDEEFFLFAEDDDLCLKLRRDGYRIIYTPHATGIHLEHQSVNKIGNTMDFVRQSNGIFDRKWGKYLDWNATRIPGNFDYLSR